MKALVLLASVFLLMNSCSRNEEEMVVTDLSIKQLTGSWKLTETYISPGGETTWQQVEDGHEFRFNADGTYNQTDSDCSSGEYSLSDSTLTLSPSCEEIGHSQFRVLDLKRMC